MSTSTGDIMHNVEMQPILMDILVLPILMDISDESNASIHGHFCLTAAHCTLSMFSLM